MQLLIIRKQERYGKRSTVKDIDSYQLIEDHDGDIYLVLDQQLLDPLGVVRDDFNILFIVSGGKLFEPIEHYNTPNEVQNYIETHNCLIYKQI